MLNGRVLVVVCLVLACCARVRAQDRLAADAAELPLTHALAISDLSSWARRPINIDAVVQVMVDGTLGEPKAGDVIQRPAALGGGERAWKELAADDKGEFVDLPRGSYVLCTVESAADRVMMLVASGHSMVYVNDEPRGGDPYALGYVRIPVALRQGRNQLLFAHAGRGPLKARLEMPKGEIEINEGDLTLPDALLGDAGRYMMGIPLINTTDRQRGLAIFADQPGRTECAERVVAEIVNLGIYKVPVPAVLRPEPGTDKLSVRLRVFEPGQISDLASNVPPKDVKPLAETTITLRVREPGEIHKRTFVSEIDGSVQYVAIVPPGAPKPEKSEKEEKTDADTVPEKFKAPEHPALVLSLHGASVEALNQAQAYSPKPDMVIVCPTNRRPFGFDWEDWGRVDAIEAMDHAKEWYRTDPERQYLTGHSMGGHGTWQLGVLYPDRFAAIAPSAGWLSFESYAAARPDAKEIGSDKAEDPIGAMFRRASSSSDTVALMDNLRGKGIYILHGDADDNVPVSEARKARAELDKLGIAYEFHEQAGAGHWWDDDKPGAACVDWAPVFEMFRKRTLSEAAQASVGMVSFSTMRSDAIMGNKESITIRQQDLPGVLSKVVAKTDRGERKVNITTTNVANMLIGEGVLPRGPWAVIEIDGVSLGKIGKADRGWLSFVKVGDGKWVADSAPFIVSGGRRSGPLDGSFKNAFAGQFMFVYGTSGNREKMRWAIAKARFDADQWWYRGNGSARVVADALLPTIASRGSNLVFYGQFADTSMARQCLPRPLVAFKPYGTGFLEVWLDGDRAILATTSASDQTRRIGLISGTSLRAMRATDRLPYFLSGVGFPDVTIMSADVWTRGLPAVDCAGFFGNDWSVERGEFVWRERGPMDVPPRP